MVSFNHKGKENYILGDIKYEGNKKIKDSKFEEDLDLTTGQRLRPNTLNETSNLIKKLYAEKGYLNTEVKPKLYISDKDSNLIVKNDGELTRNIIFQITENNKTKINKILFVVTNLFRIYVYVGN